MYLLSYKIGHSRKAIALSFKVQSARMVWVDKTEKELLNLFLFFMVLRTESGTFHMLGQCFTTE
jgi:hypothetical protein